MPLDPRSLSPSDFRQFLVMTAFSAGGNQELAKSFSADVTNFKPESFGPTAYVETWRPGRPGFLTVLRMLPKRAARQLQHSEAKLTSYGDSAQNTGFGGERGPSVATDPSRGKLSRYLKPQHQRAVTGAVVNLEAVVSMDDGTGANTVEQDRMSALNRQLRSVNRGLIHANTDGWRGGEATGLAYKGLLQQIEEGTDGTEGTSLTGASHAYDAEGGVLDITDVGIKLSAIQALHGGGPNCLIMPAQQRQAIANSYENSSINRYELNAGPRPIVVGKQLLAVNAGGQILPVFTENDLAWENYGKRPTTTPDGGPTGTPTFVSVTAGSTSGAEVSYWDADSDGADIWYAVSEVNSAGIEGAATRYPSGSSYVTVTAGQKVTLVLRASSLDIQGLRVYRGKGTAEASLVGQVANSDDGSSVTFTDFNEVRPQTDLMLALPLAGPIFERLMAQPENAQSMDVLAGLIRGDMANYMDNLAPMDAAVMVAYLGSPIMRLQLGITGLYANDEEIFSVQAPFVRGARHCAFWRNLGRS